MVIFISHIWATDRNRQSITASFISFSTQDSQRIGYKDLKIMALENDRNSKS